MKKIWNMDGTVAAEVLSVEYKKRNRVGFPLTRVRWGEYVIVIGAEEYDDGFRQWAEVFRAAEYKNKYRFVVLDAAWGNYASEEYSEFSAQEHGELLDDIYRLTGYYIPTADEI